MKRKQHCCNHLYLKTKILKEVKWVNSRKVFSREKNPIPKEKIKKLGFVLTCLFNKKYIVLRDLKYFEIEIKLGLL